MEKKLMKKYYEAYDERYKAIHEKGYRWTSEEITPVVYETIRKYDISVKDAILEIGCGEGRDASYLLQKGYRLLASDISPEAISYCRNLFPAYKNRFQVMDCLDSKDENHYDFIYSVAVIHMLLLNDDRKGFYRFIHDHLSEKGIALICTMGDGQSEMMTDIDDAFALQERDHPSGKVTVAGTSLRMISFEHFEQELAQNGLQIIEKGLTSCLPEFNSLMYAVVKSI